MSKFHDPAFKARLEHLRDWLADGRELKRLQELVAYAKAHPRNRESTEYKVRNPDGSVYIPPKLSAQKSVVTISSTSKQWLRPLRATKDIIRHRLKRDSSR